MRDFLNSTGFAFDEDMTNITDSAILINSTLTVIPQNSALPSDAPLIIVLYSTIFVLSVVGNTLVILTLLQNKRMRTVTNVFLLNLAVSDLLLGVFCMPFTLIGGLLRNFLFGEVMCRLINYFQGVSVSVGVWTLVSISLERYFAICRPLHSRQWQTISHAYRVIVLVWAGSLLTMAPSLLLSQLLPTRRSGKYKCREVWPDESSEKAFNIYLDVVLLVIPLVIMILVYSLIARKLCAGSRLAIIQTRRNGEPSQKRERQYLDPLQHQMSPQRRSAEQSAKTRVVRMLFVVVVEFFVCWTPLYVVNTWALFDAQSMYASLGYAGLLTVHLLAYTSSCCNPLTYCFMHQKYRHSFLAVIGCKGSIGRRYGGQSERSGTMVSVFSTRAGSVKSETVDKGNTSSSF